MQANKLNSLISRCIRKFWQNVSRDGLIGASVPVLSSRMEEKVRPTESLDFNRRPDRKEARQRNCSRIGLRARKLIRRSVPARVAVKVLPAVSDYFGRACRSACAASADDVAREISSGPWLSRISSPD